jgi:hypothetical protein
MTIRILALCAVMAFAWMGVPDDAAAQAKSVQCRLTYDIAGWSFFYRYQSGTGKVTCSNGQSANVNIRVHGGGATLGTSTATAGHGGFGAVRDISDVYGGYFEVAAHGSAGVGGGARAMFKGAAALSLVSSGNGVGAGVTMGYFGIKPQ